MSTIRRTLDVVITPAGWRGLRKVAELLLAPAVVMLVIWPFGLGTIKSPAGLVACVTAAAVLIGGLTAFGALWDDEHLRRLTPWRNAIWGSMIGLAVGIPALEVVISAARIDNNGVNQFVGVDTPDTTRMALEAIGFYVGFIVNTLFALRDGSFPLPRRDAHEPF